MSLRVGIFGGGVVGGGQNSKVLIALQNYIIIFFIKQKIKVYMK
jgi:hypothetical protein